MVWRTGALGRPAASQRRWGSEQRSAVLNFEKQLGLSQFLTLLLRARLYCLELSCSKPCCLENSARFLLLKSSSASRPCQSSLGAV
jgi:hypothetical protein